MDIQAQISDRTAYSEPEQIEPGTRVITLEDLWQILIQHIIPIVLAGMISALGFFTYGKLTVVPKYSSNATLYILKQEATENISRTSDFSLAMNTISDVSYMIRSHEVLDAVIDELHLDIGYSALYKMISISNPEGTRIIEVTCTTTDPVQSKQIVDSVCLIASENVNATMGVNQVNVFAQGTISATPSNGVSKTRTALIGMGVAAAVYAVYLIAFVLDDRVKNVEDVDKYLGLSVLGEIPNSSEQGSGRYGRYGKYYRYGRYGRYGRYYGGRYGRYSQYSGRYGGRYGQYGGRYGSYYGQYGVYGNEPTAAPKEGVGKKAKKLLGKLKNKLNDTSTRKK